MVLAMCLCVVLGCPCYHLATTLLIEQLSDGGEAHCVARQAIALNNSHFSFASIVIIRQLGTASIQQLKTER
jgi:hypothetical protein